MDITGIGSIADLLKAGVERIWPDKSKQEEAKAAIEQAQLAGQLQEMQAAWDNARGQLDVNKVEAASSSLWVSGWRPFVGWCCGSAFAYAYIMQPLMIFTATCAGKNLHDLPSLDIAGMMPVLLGMLGLGGMRTFEKIKGAA